MLSAGDYGTESHAAESQDLGLHHRMIIWPMRMRNESAHCGKDSMQRYLWAISPSRFRAFRGGYAHPADVFETLTLWWQ